MAVEARKSSLITNKDASPPVDAGAFVDHGRVREVTATIEAVNADSVGSTFRMVRLWSGWRVSELMHYSDDIGTTTAADVGLYRTTADGGAVVDADFFASAVSLNAGALGKTDITYESAAVDIAKRGQRLWEQLGLTADPLVWYDVTYTLTGAADAGGTITLTVRYVDGT